VIKVATSGGVLSPRDDPRHAHLRPAELEALVEEATAAGMFVMAHAQGADGIKNAVRAGIRSIDHGIYLDDEGIELMLRHGTFWVADIYDGDWIDEQGRREGWPAETLAKNTATADAQRQAFRLAVEAGVVIAYGTDSGVYPHGWNARQFAYMVRHGMSPLAAIRAATTVAAELLGWSDNVGSLAPGRWADLVAVDGDPLVDVSVLERPAAVVQGGYLIEAERPRRPAAAGR
jgi:imidazolonepropionase-like amidohydrolase